MENKIHRHFSFYIKHPKTPYQFFLIDHHHFLFKPFVPYIGQGLWFDDKCSLHAERRL